MKIIWKNFAAACLAAVMVLLVAPVNADPAFVLNSGRDGLECSGSLDEPLDGFEGHASLVATASGNIMFKCNASILGDPPEVRIRLTEFPGPFGTFCNVVLTPSGRLNAVCHN